jgi:hypothetical protein
MAHAHTRFQPIPGLARRRHGRGRPASGSLRRRHPCPRVPTARTPLQRGPDDTRQVEAGGLEASSGEKPGDLPTAGLYDDARSRGDPPSGPSRWSVSRSLGTACDGCGSLRKGGTITRPPHTCRAIRFGSTHSLGMGISPRPGDCSRTWQGTHVPIQLSGVYKSRKCAQIPRRASRGPQKRPVDVVGWIPESFGGGSDRWWVRVEASDRRTVYRSLQECDACRRPRS